MASITAATARWPALPALELLGRTLAACGVAECRWLLDQPVSNSGRLKGMIEEMGATHGWPWRAELLPNPDSVLSAAGAAVKSVGMAVELPPRQSRVPPGIVGPRPTRHSRPLPGVVQSGAGDDCSARAGRLGSENAVSGEKGISPICGQHGGSTFVGLLFSLLYSKQPKPADRGKVTFLLPGILECGMVVMPSASRVSFHKKGVDLWRAKFALPPCVCWPPSWRRRVLPSFWPMVAVGAAVDTEAEAEDLVAATWAAWAATAAVI